MINRFGVETARFVVIIGAAGLAIGDNIHIVVPNAQLWGSAIRNSNHHDKRRVDLTIGNGCGDDLTSPGRHSNA
ncbi:MAG: hypothetical protein JKY27_07150 [Magnetovibrio sp.]|nr:hypothetical protein [Magnetovibrio sp.]